MAAWIHVAGGVVQAKRCFSGTSYIAQLEASKFLLNSEAPLRFSNLLEWLEVLYHVLY